MKRFTTKDIENWKPNYLPEDWSGTALDILKHPKIPPAEKLWIVCRDGIIDDKTLRLFAVWCATQVKHLLKDERSVNSLEVAERFAYGKATKEELKTASVVAYAVAYDAASDAGSDAAAYAVAYAAASAAAYDAASNAASDAAYAASDAAYDAASNAASDAAYAASAASAASDAASDVAYAAAYAAARDKQVGKLIEMLRTL